MNQRSKSLPRGIEVLVKKASIDQEFKALLIERRAEAAGEIGLELTTTEAAMLAAIPRELFERIIDQTEVPQESRRAFLGKAAAAMLAALGVNLTGCSAIHRMSAGSRPAEAMPYEDMFSPIRGSRSPYPLPDTLPIYFTYDESTIRPDQLSRMEINLQYFLANTGFKVIIEGHADERGTIEYNFALGQRRAEAVKAYLVRNGIPENRLIIVSKGEEQPCDFDHNEESWAKNRRVQFMGL